MTAISTYCTALNLTMVCAPLRMTHVAGKRKLSSGRKYANTVRSLLYIVWKGDLAKVEFWT